MYRNLEVGFEHGPYNWHVSSSCTAANNNAVLAQVIIILAKSYAWQWCAHTVILQPLRNSECILVWATNVSMPSYTSLEGIWGEATKHESKERWDEEWAVMMRTAGESISLHQRCRERNDKKGAKREMLTAWLVQREQIRQENGDVEGEIQRDL